MSGNTKKDRNVRKHSSGLFLKFLILARQMEELDSRIIQCACREKELASGRVRIAVLTSLVSAMLSKTLKDYQSRYPGIAVEIKEGTPNEIFAMIEEHAADFAVSCSPFGKFDAVTLVCDRMMAMFPPDSTEKGAVSLSHPPKPLIVNKPAYETILDHMKEKDFVKLDHMILVQNADTAIRMVEDGVGVGILSKYTLETLAPEHPKYEVEPVISFDIGLFAGDLGDLTPAAAEFARLLRENVSGETGDGREEEDKKRICR